MPGWSGLLGAVLFCSGANDFAITTPPWVPATIVDNNVTVSFQESQAKNKKYFSWQKLKICAINILTASAVGC